MRWLLCLTMAGLIAGCVTTQSYDQLVGQGRVDLSERTWASYKRYTALPNPGAFAINPANGRTRGNYCSEVQCNVGDWKRTAVDRCTAQTGSQCKLFANDKKIIWRGPVYVLGSMLAALERTPLSLMASIA